MPWQSSRALDFDSIVEKPNVDINQNAVVAMQQGIDDDLMEGFRWVRTGVQAARPNF
jgi:hypothetical protein